MSRTAAYDAASSVRQALARGISCIDLGENLLTGPEAVPGAALEACARLEALLLDANNLTQWPLPTAGGLTAALPLRDLNLANNVNLRQAPPGAACHILSATSSDAF